MSVRTPRDIADAIRRRIRGGHDGCVAVVAEIAPRRPGAGHEVRR